MTQQLTDINVDELLKKHSMEDSIKELENALTKKNDPVIERLDIRDMINCCVANCNKYATYKKNHKELCWSHVRTINN